MDIQLTEEGIFVLEERLSFEEVRQRAMDKRGSAFASGLGGLLQRPKAEDITLVTSQRRLEPFWHVGCQARYVYDRSRDYVVPVSGPEVREVSVEGTTYPVAESGKTARAFIVPTMEHCREEFRHELFADGATGGAVADGASIVTGPRREVTEPATLATDDTIVLPPEHRASYVVRQLLGEMLKPVQADRVLEESLTLDVTDLYYRPIWAFEFNWKPKDRMGVVEIDGLSGQVRQGGALVPRLTRMVTRDALFDIGADTIGLLVPGGNIAVKVAKLAIDQGKTK